jgi:hypothetical protein
MKAITNKADRILEIKRLLRLGEIAQAKVEFNYNGTKVINPMQQSAATRIFRQAWGLQGEMLPQEVISLHTEVINELRNEQIN